MGEEGEPLSPTEEIIIETTSRRPKSKNCCLLTENEDNRTERGVTSSAKRCCEPLQTGAHRKVAGTGVTHKDFRRNITTTVHLSQTASPGGTNQRHYTR